jgi:CRISPR-associated protein Cas6
MFWHDEQEKKPEYKVPDDVVDLCYQFTCQTLPLDHAWSFSQAIQAVLPWIEDEQYAGIHLIHGAESGNGWFRPEDPETELLHLSRRIKMSLRVPKHRIEDARKLEGAELDIEGFKLIVGESSIKKLSSLSTLFARYVVVADAMDEEAFLQNIMDQFQAMGLNVQKLMGGKQHFFRSPDGKIETRTVMVADLEPEQSVLLQQNGVGPGRNMGFGLFIPHKGIKAVTQTH